MIRNDLPRERALVAAKRTAKTNKAFMMVFLSFRRWRGWLIADGCRRIFGVEDGLDDGAGEIPLLYPMKAGGPSLSLGQPLPLPLSLPLYRYPLGSKSPLRAVKTRKPD